MYIVHVHACSFSQHSLYLHVSVKVDISSSADKQTVSDTFMMDSTLCLVEVKGAYPSLQIADIRGDGVASSLSKSRIWQMLSIEK